MHSLYVGGMYRHPRESGGEWEGCRGAESMTNQHPEQAARWAFWIIYGSGRQSEANQSEQRTTKGKLWTSCFYYINVFVSLKKYMFLTNK